MKTNRTLELSKIIKKLLNVLNSEQLFCFILVTRLEVKTLPGLKYFHKFPQTLFAFLRIRDVFYFRWLFLKLKSTWYHALLLHFLVANKLIWLNKIADMSIFFLRLVV